MTLLVGRVFISGLFLWDGVILLRAPGPAADYMAAHGVPGLLLPAVILLQLGGGLSILAGWQTRIVALAFAGFALLTALIFHADTADTDQLIHFAKDIAIAGGFLFLAAGGPGAFSIDAMRRARRA
ncbi:MAG: DoxX family protein [Hyphomicrobiales bacterium]|nr:DoxX family protein [Hyphomicrobiales bacterium]